MEAARSGYWDEVTQLEMQMSLIQQKYQLKSPALDAVFNVKAFNDGVNTRTLSQLERARR